MKAFYSWQSDISGQRNAIEKQLKKAIKRINKDIELDFAVDRDTKGLAGAVDISDTIFDKIDNSNIFISDITIVSPRFCIPLRPDKKRHPNPNVLIELGYAARKLGWGRIIMLYNKSCGKEEYIPFDLRQRRILIFDGVTNDLSESLFQALKAICSDLPMEVRLNRDFADEYDIKIFERLMKNIPESDVENQLDWIGTNGYYEYSSTRYLFSKYEEIQEARNRFCDEYIQEKCDNFGRAVKRLCAFMAKNFFTCKGNSDLAKMNRFENITDFQKADDMFWNLNEELNRDIDTVIDSFREFRLAVRDRLYV